MVIKNQIIDVWKGETLYLEGDYIFQTPQPEIEVRRFEKQSITTLQSSWAGARIGKYFDVLKPVANDADITAFKVLPSLRGNQISIINRLSPADHLTLRISDRILPEKRVFPIYGEVNSYDCLKAYFKAIGSAEEWSQQGPQTVKAIKLARQFGIEPIKQAMVWFDGLGTDPIVDIDHYGAYSYRKLVLENTIAPPMIWCGTKPDSHGENGQLVKFLQQINLAAPEGSIAYCADEPGTRGMELPQAVKRIRDVLQYAPRLRPMVTTGPQKEFEGLDVIYVEVQNSDPGHSYEHGKGSYFSCMAQGNCQNTGQPKPRTRFPVAVVEGDPVLDFQRAIHLAYSNGADFALYYCLTKNICRCWEPGGIYSEGGNGDGTAMYYDPETGDPWPSVRMMHWHIAQQAVEKNIMDIRPLPTCDQRLSKGNYR